MPAPECLLYERRKPYRPCVASRHHQQQRMSVVGFHAPVRCLRLQHLAAPARQKGASPRKERL